MISHTTLARGLFFFEKTSIRYNGQPNSKLSHKLFKTEFARTEKRHYTLRRTSYYSQYIPPTGIPTENGNDEPWDAANRPKRRVGQIAVRLEKLIRENDYYTMFKNPEPVVHVQAPIEIPEPRGVTLFINLSITFLRPD